MKLFVLLCTLVAPSQVSAAEDPMTRLVSGFCIECHGQNEPEGDLRLDVFDAAESAESGRLETLIDVLTERHMPPVEARQPALALRAEAVAYLKETLAQQPRSGALKRLTREEYTNTINDLFDADFDLTELLPPDRPGDGFNKWGETQRMSPHQVESYLKTARFVADRLILDERPEQREWEFSLEHFNGSGRGDFKTDSEFVLSTHYPWRSNLHFFQTADRKEIFRIPEYGRYHLEADVSVRHSDAIQTISVSTGDPRYPTNFKKVARMTVPPEGGTVAVDLTLTEGTFVSYTYESAATWNVGSNPEKYKGPQVAFSRVHITGPITPEWPTPAEQLIFADGRGSHDQTHALSDHVIGVLLNRSLSRADVAAFRQLTRQRLDETDSLKAAARTLLTALLSSPHFIYKHEPDVLDGTALAYRLSYFLWNSGPDARLIELAGSGMLQSSEVRAEQVERMLADSRSERFCEDFTRQWLQTDRIDDFGPDDRLHDKKEVTFLRIRELAEEPRAFFREILWHNLSMTNFIDSEFVMVNDETAAFYGYEAQTGRKFRPIEIPAGSERGGLVGQAGLLKLTSSKFATSPIRRGSWILKNIYGRRLNPPPDLVFEEPDVRGAETVRDVIEKHKSITACNRCHALIDPLGLALEHYDEMGRRRDEYRIVATESLENSKTSLQWRTAPIDSVAVLPDGRRISSMTELKAALMDDREQVLKGILAKLASYALAREVGISDEAMIDEIYDSIAVEEYSLRAAVHAIVAHESFGRR